MIQSAVAAYDAIGDFEHAAINVDNLSESWMLMGKFDQALSDIRLGRVGIPYAELTDDHFRRMQTLCLRGDILLRMGRYNLAEQAFEQAEKIRLKHHPHRQPVRSLYYLDLLADLNRVEELLTRADRFRPLLDERNAKPFTGFFYLVLGRAYALNTIDGERSSRGNALKLFDDARQLIDMSNLPHLMPRPRIERAKLLLQLNEHRQAEADLESALAIAQSSRLSLYECDCYLGLCQLSLARRDRDRARDHLRMAEQVIAAGYGRRKSWFEEMSEQVKADC